MQIDWDSFALGVLVTLTLVLLVVAVVTSVNACRRRTFQQADAALRRELLARGCYASGPGKVAGLFHRVEARHEGNLNEPETPF